MKVAARRHFRAANELADATGAGAQPGCKAVAGHLFGLCGELALKAIMIDSGMLPLPDDAHRTDPFFAHFPSLKQRLLDQVQGRRAGELRRIAECPRLFQEWDIGMRYAPTIQIPAARVDAWRADAAGLIKDMDSG
jgi:hypothetical protein